MYLETGAPMRGAALDRLVRFLRGCGLDYDPNISFTAALMENDRIIAAGSLDGATLKCIAVDPAFRGEDLCARLMTELRREAFRRGIEHLTLYTKPENEALFRGLGFYPLSRTADALLMENRARGLEAYLASLPRPTGKGEIGCVVAHADPFTLGHRHLVETAARQSDAVHLFILSEDKGRFPARDRLELARAACAKLGNVYVHPTGPYMVSSATFPDYFIRDKARVNEIRCALDVRLFGEKIAPALGISRRYVGSEPFCPVTRAYNAALKAQLPRWEIEFIELPRLEIGGEAVSASRVRALCADGRLAEVRALVPENVWRYLNVHPF